MNKELLRHNMENMGGCDRANLLKGLIHSNELDANELVEHIEKTCSDFSNHPGQDTGDAETLTYYAKRGTVLKALLHEVESPEHYLDFAGRAALKTLQQQEAYNANLEISSDDLEAVVGQKLSNVRAKLLDSVQKLVRFDNYKMQLEMREAKIKALIELFPG